MTAKEHDTQLLWQAYNAGYDFPKLDELECQCLTREFKGRIHRMKMQRWHKEEERANML